METTLNGKVIWNEAAKTGFALGAVCVAYMAFSHVTSILAANGAGLLLINLLTFILWAAKFALCILVMKRAMERLAMDYSETTNRSTFMLGAISSFLSALIVAAANLAYISFIAKDAYEAGIASIMNTFSSVFDSNTLKSAEKMIENLPIITFFSQIVYCFMYGLILSAILSWNIPSKNPFSKR